MVDDTSINSLLLSALPLRTRKLLSCRLNPTKVIRGNDPRRLLRDWRGLASLVNISSQDESYIQQQCEDKTAKVLEFWLQQDNTANVEQLLNHLETIDRFDVQDDVVEDLRSHVSNGQVYELSHHKTHGRQRGVLVLLSYIDFLDNEGSRQGTHRDDDNLMYLFSEFGFKTVKCLNLYKQETIDKLSSLEQTLEGSECVFIVVCSHRHERISGSEYDIRCSDGRLISDLEILRYFSNNSLPKLIGIPKIIVFQDCRDSVMTLSEQTDGTPLVKTLNAGSRLPEQSFSHLQFTDMLVVYSTLYGNTGWLGSWYIQTLCDVFAARAHDTDVVTMFSLIDQRIRKNDGKLVSSVCSAAHHLTVKRLSFKPTDEDKMLLASCGNVRLVKI